MRKSKRKSKRKHNNRRFSRICFYKKKGTSAIENIVTISWTLGTAHFTWSGRTTVSLLGRSISPFLSPFLGGVRKFSACDRRLAGKNSEQGKEDRWYKGYFAWQEKVLCYHSHSLTLQRILAAIWSIIKEVWCRCYWKWARINVLWTFSKPVKRSDKLESTYKNDR